MARTDVHKKYQICKGHVNFNSQLPIACETSNYSLASQLDPIILMNYINQGLEECLALKQLVSRACKISICSERSKVKSCHTFWGAFRLKT